MTEKSVQVQQTITTPDALNWFPPDKRKCYKDSLQDPIQAGGGGFILDHFGVTFGFTFGFTFG